MSEHQQTQQSKKTNTIFQNQATLVRQTPLSNPYSIIQRAKINPQSLTYADIMQLQRTIGNQAVGRLLSGIGSSSTAQHSPVQRQQMPEESCPSCMQRQKIPEEEEPLQGKLIEPIQRREIPEEEEPLQGKFESGPEKEKCPSCMQRQEIPEEEPLQGKMVETVQRQEIPEEEGPLQTKRENNTGMPDNLKAGVESLSGIDMSDVRVHYNSNKPAEVGALAYTQGTNIHVAPSQERYLPHEAWHVVQQMQGRVKPTMQAKGVSINDDAALEREADVMGSHTARMGMTLTRSTPIGRIASIGVKGSLPIQRALNSEQIRQLRKRLGSNKREPQILVTKWERESKFQDYNTLEDAYQAILAYLQIKENALIIYRGNHDLIQSMIVMHDLAQSQQFGYSYDTRLLEKAVRLNLLAKKLRDDWNWDPDWIQQLINLDFTIGNTIGALLYSFMPVGVHYFVPPPQAPLQVVEWGDDYVDHLIGSKARLASPDFKGTRFVEIGNLRGTDNEEPLSEGHPRHFKGAIPYAFIRSSRRAILDLVQQVGDSVAIFSLERGGALLADHITDLRSLMQIQQIPNVKVPKSTGIINGIYNRTRHHLSLVCEMMDTEEGQMFRLMSRDTRVLNRVPTITIALAETAVSGGSVNTLLGTLQKYHSLLPYSKYRLLIEKQTIKEENLIGKPLGGGRVWDPGICVEKELTVDTIPRIELFIAQTEYILGEDVGYQVSYDHRLTGIPLVIFDETSHQLIAVKLSQDDMLPRDMLRLLLMGAFDSALADIFKTD